VALSSLYLDGTPSVLVEGSVIRAVGAPPPKGARRLDCEGGVVCAGAVNAHTHLYSGLAPLGMPSPRVPPENFRQILERVWWKLDRSLDEASLRAAARLYVAEALLAGTTALVDHHESPAFVEGSLDVLAAAAQSLGCRLVTCFGATDRNGGHVEGQLGLRECRRFLEANQRPLVRGMVGLHASFTVSDHTVRAAGELARELEVPVHVHVAEDAADVEDAKQRGFAGPLERLGALGALPPGSIVAHGVHLSEAQVAAAEAAGLWLVHNPRSNAQNRVGFARSLAKSGRVALGTDGYPADMRAERAALEEQARLAGAELDEERVRARVDGGLRLLSERFGELFAPEPGVGVAADLCVWRKRDDGLQAGVVPLHVIVAGRVVVEHGRLVHGDLEEIRAYAADEAPRVWRAMEALA
jgi:cytosine/adenosine deaminase-related metal-dependent hydrolase